MFTALIVLTLLVCVLLMLVVLAQNPKGGGLNTQFGGAGASQLMGVKRTGDLLERMTWILAVCLMVFALTAHAMLGSNSAPTQLRSVNMEKARQAPAPSPVAAPQTPPPGTQAPAADGAVLPAAGAAEGAGATATPAPASAPAGTSSKIDMKEEPAPAPTPAQEMQKETSADSKK